ncbi:MAG: hypothetical protein H0W99_13955, partial [Acidobacteria bacterium]|nr:hypothetical protein [Acidobacteriota bacterium]
LRLHRLPINKANTLAAASTESNDCVVADITDKPLKVQYYEALQARQSWDEHAAALKRCMDDQDRAAEHAARFDGALPELRRARVN